MKHAGINQSDLDYPYPTDFMGNVPGWPVNVACQSLDKAYGQLELLDAIHNGQFSQKFKTENNPNL